jgi:hypothetical protein
MPAVVTTFCTHPATALWDEVVGVYVDESASFLRYLKLATRYIAEERLRGADLVVDNGDGLLDADGPLSEESAQLW